MTNDRDFVVGRGVQPHHALLAGTMLAPDSAGAKGLTDKELAELRDIAAVKPE